MKRPKNKNYKLSCQGREAILGIRGAQICSCEGWLWRPSLKFGTWLKNFWCVHLEYPVLRWPFLRVDNIMCERDPFSTKGDRASRVTRPVGGLPQEGPARAVCFPTEPDLSPPIDAWGCPRHMAMHQVLGQVAWRPSELSCKPAQLVLPAGSGQTCGHRARTLWPEDGSFPRWKQPVSCL